MTEVKAYVCDFCPRKKRFAQKGTTARHEARCFYNPTQKACATCANFNYERDYYEPETGYGEGGPECSKGLLNNDPEASTQLRNHCEGWEPKLSPIIPLKQVRIGTEETR